MLFEEYRREYLKEREAEQKGDEKRRKLEEVADEDTQAEGTQKNPKIFQKGKLDSHDVQKRQIGSL